MPELRFEGETHDELVRKVRRWLDSAEGRPTPISAAEAVEAASDITKDALAVIAAAAPAPIAGNEVFKRLTRMGYDATDTTKRAVTSGLAAMSDVNEGGLLKRAEGARKSVVYEMNAAVARQILKSIKPR